MALYILAAAACFIAALALVIAIVALKKTLTWSSSLLDHVIHQSELNKQILDICKSNTDSIKGLSEATCHLSSACNALSDAMSLTSEMTKP